MAKNPGVYTTVDGAGTHVACYACGRIKTVNAERDFPELSSGNAGRYNAELRRLAEGHMKRKHGKSRK